jgi:hypothetical protein
MAARPLPLKRGDDDAETASVSCDSRSESVKSHDREPQQTGETHDDREKRV